MKWVLVIFMLQQPVVSVGSYDTKEDCQQELIEKMAGLIAKGKLDGATCIPVIRLK